MKQSKWIWKPGDFELYHSMLLHNRRTFQGIYYPPMWRVDAPAHNVTLYKKAVLEQPEELTVYANTAQASIVTWVAVLVPCVVLSAVGLWVLLRRKYA